MSTVNETGLRGERKRDGKGSETDGWALEREGLSRIKMGQEEQKCSRTWSKHCYHPLIA